jgi:UDP-N-acetyl-D-glucosamine dehydrogenase
MPASRTTIAPTMIQKVVVDDVGGSPPPGSPAHEINAQMPGYVVQKVADALNVAALPISGSRLLLLGLAYKADVHDTREWPSLEVMRQLLARHGEVSYCDPWVREIELDEVHHRGVDRTDETVEGADRVVVLTPHRRFPQKPHREHASLVVDTRNVLPDAPGVAQA